MQDISTSSKKISDIIGVIDEIAFQTNILALNAAVEAALAGEQGRGLAVVPSEVSNLATRSAKAAKEIKSLISASVEKVDVGSTLVDEAGRSMEGTVNQLRQLGALIHEISHFSSMPPRLQPRRETTKNPLPEEGQRVMRWPEAR